MVKKTTITLDNGQLEYKQYITYLAIKTDIDLFVEEKRSDITIKYNNFCKINFLAPIDIKMKVLDTCV